MKKNTLLAPRRCFPSFRTVYKSCEKAMENIGASILTCLEIHICIQNVGKHPLGTKRLVFKFLRIFLDVLRRPQDVLGASFIKSCENLLNLKPTTMSPICCKTPSPHQESLKYLGFFRSPKMALGSIATISFEKLIEFKTNNNISKMFENPPYSKLRL